VTTAVPLATFGESGMRLQVKGAEIIDSGTHSLSAWLGARRRLIVGYAYTITRSISHEAFVDIARSVMNLRHSLETNSRRLRNPD
jgi:hypothetical protein